MPLRQHCVAKVEKGTQPASSVSPGRIIRLRRGLIALPQRWCVSYCRILHRFLSRFNADPVGVAQLEEETIRCNFHY